MGRVKGARRRRGLFWLCCYGALLAASQMFIAISGFDPYRPPDSEAPGAERINLVLPAFEDDGPAPGDTTNISMLRWRAEHVGEIGEAAPARPPVLLLHGSPATGAMDYRWLAPVIAARGYEVIALDFPGFGRSSGWTPSYSIIANARFTLAVMDALSIERAHAVGWSQSGGTALHMADMAPDRLASITLLGAIGVQEGEGSGDYHFEHFKYAVGYALVVALPEAVPHFNLLGTRQTRHGFIRNFWDSDQRPLRAIMARITIPTLVLHGRHDPLVPAWAAEESYRLIPTSRLVMLDDSHFFPVGGMPGDGRSPAERAATLETTADILTTFFARHDAPGAAPLRQAADFAPVDPGAGRIHLGPFEFVQGIHWGWLIVLIILATFISEDATVITVGMLIAAARLDFFVGLLGCMIGIAVGDGLIWAIGRFLGRRALGWPLFRRWVPEQSLERWGRWFDKHTIAAVFLARAIPGTRLPTYFAAGILSRRTHHFLLWAALAAFLWTPLLLAIVILVGPALLERLYGLLGGPLAVVAAILLILLAIRVLSGMTTWVGRRRLAVDFFRLFRPEFWPTWLFYLPLVPCVALFALRRGSMTFTCMNPGVPHGGGIIGESKHQIIRGLIEGGAGEFVVRSELIRAGRTPATRAAEVDSLVRADATLAGWPVILKPDESQRGHALKLARSPADAHRYFESMTRDAILQAYHPGPLEVGVLWARRPPGAPGAANHRVGDIFSITRKVFPVIVGDGRSTLERLIWLHPRFRMQAPTFLKRFADQTDYVLDRGETLRLAVAGNHCQGAKFLDGAHLITESLADRLDSIVRDFPGGFDFGRFDIRYQTDDDLRRADHFVIIELNGAMSESTNMYDPTKSILWTYGVLVRQWSLMYRLGQQRRRAGVKPMSLPAVFAAVREHYRGKPGSAVSD